MKIGVVAQHANGVTYHRLLKPFSLLKDDYDLTLCEGINSDIFEHDFDVIIFNRMLPMFKQKKFLQELRKRGTYVICDIDDHWLLPQNHVSKKSGDKLRTQSIEALKYSDEVWVTHEHLGKEVDRLNGNWYVIPNALDPTDEQWKPKESYGQSIGWAGGITHFNDLMLTKDCFKRPPVVCGWSDDAEWIRLRKEFPAQYIKAADVANYGNLYNYFDIAIAPLVDNKFNTYKSNLKILEAGLKGLPIFVQNIHPYIDDAKGIYKVDNWMEAIQKAEAMESNQIEQEGSELRLYIMENYDLRNINRLRIERL